MEDFIADYFGTGVVLLKDTNIEVFKSAQVNLKNIDEGLEYMKIPVSQLSSLGNKYITEKGANKVSLDNQKLQVGDVLISARSKLNSVKLIRHYDLNKRMPTVAAKGIIIIRTKNENLGFFVKYFFELPEVKDYINNSDSSLDKYGKRKIDIEFILNMSFPDILNNDFNTFAKYKEYYSRIEGMEFKINRKITKIRNKQLADIYRRDLNNPDSYNEKDWQEIKSLYEKINSTLDRIENKLL